MQQLINKGDILKSTRTTKELKCYNISAVYVGEENRLYSYEYSFYDGKNRKIIRHNKLREMLAKNWSVKTADQAIICSFCGYANPNHEDNCINNHKEVNWLKQKLIDKESNNAISFAEWMGDGFERLGITRWQCFSDEYCAQYKLSLDTLYTTRELYNIYQGKLNKEQQIHLVETVWNKYPNNEEAFDTPELQNAYKAGVYDGFLENNVAVPIENKREVLVDIISRHFQTGVLHKEKIEDIVDDIMSEVIDIE